MQQCGPQAVMVLISLELGDNAHRAHTEKAHSPVEEIENNRCHCHGADIDRRVQVPYYGRIDHPLQGNSQIGQDQWPRQAQQAAMMI